MKVFNINVNVKSLQQIGILVNDESVILALVYQLLALPEFARLSFHIDVVHLQVPGGGDGGGGGTLRQAASPAACVVRDGELQVGHAERR